jgi:hypothetical protein
VAEAATDKAAPPKTTLRPHAYSALRLPFLIKFEFRFLNRFLMAARKSGVYFIRVGAKPVFHLTNVRPERFYRRNEMKKFMTIAGLLAVFATPTFAGANAFAMVPKPTSAHPYGSSRVPAFDYRNGTSEYPFGPGYNLPYPDRPYGDPDHW